MYFMFSELPSRPGMVSPFHTACLILLGLFPLFVMFLITSITMQRERASGTLERILTTPLRRLDLLSGPVTRDTKEGGKRIFSKVYSIAVSSELFIEQVVASDQQRRADTEARLEGVGHEPIIPAPLESFRVFRDR